MNRFIANRAKRSDSPAASPFASRLRRGTLLTLVVSALAGCVHYEARPIDPAATAQNWSARSLSNEGLHRFLQKASPALPSEWPLTQWDLDQLTLAAIYNQPALAVARAQWEVARAGTVTASERPNPSITAGATYNSTTPPPWIPAVSFDVPIEIAGKRGHRITQAQAAADAAHWDWIDKIWQVRASVRTALLGVYSARESAQLLEQQVKAQSEVVRLLEGQLGAGEIAVPDVTQVRIALNTNRLGLEQARQQESEALATLADAVGLPAAALAHVSLSFAGLDRFPTDPAPADAEREAVLRRADVRSALASYAASQAALQGEIANQYPDIHLGPGYEFDQTDNKWTLGVTLPLPILNQNQGPIAEAKARRQLAAAQFLAAQAKVINEVDLALTSFRTAVIQERTAAALQQQVEQRLDSVRGMRQAGETDALAVASAEVESSSSATLRLDALIKAQEALGRLEAAMQSPLIISDRVLAAATAASPEGEKQSHEP